PPPHRAPHPCPTRRSSDLSSIRSLLRICNATAVSASITKTATIRILFRISVLLDSTAAHPTQQPPQHHRQGQQRRNQCNVDHLQDRKSTRLNSSHVKISYA